MVWLKMSVLNTANTRSPSMRTVLSPKNGVELIYHEKPPLLEIVPRRT